MAEYKYKIIGDTKQAVIANEQLEGSVEGITQSTNQLKNSTKGIGDSFDKTLKTSDVRIKAIGGSINLLGGAVETVVGSLGLIGLDEETIKQFQGAAASAIALADGAKRVFEGFKEITEAQKGFAELNNASTASENANTTALVANAAAAEEVTVAQNTAAASILKEKGATDKNTVSKGLNTASSTANAAATEVQTVATQKLTTIQKVELAVEQALVKIRAISLGGWLAIAIALGTAITLISSWIASNKKLASETENLNDFIVDNVKLTKEQNSTYASSVSRLRVLEAIISDNTVAEKDRNLALQEAKKLIPELEKVDLRRADAIDKIREAIGREIAALEQRAKAQAVQQKLTEAYSRQLELVNEVQAEFAKQGFQISEFEARAALQRTDQVGVTANLAKEYQNLNKQIQTGTASLVTYASATVTSNGASTKSAEITKQQASALESYNLQIQKYNQAQSERNKKIAEELRLANDVDAIGENVSARFIKRQSTIPSIVSTTAEATKKQYANQYQQFLAFTEDLNNSLIDFLNSGAGQAIQQGLATFQTLLSEYGNLQQEAIDIELNALQRQYQRRIELLDAQAKAEILSAEEVARLKEKITTEYEAKELTIQKGALENQKKLRRAQVGVTTAQSVIDAYNTTATLPPPLNLLVGSALAATYVALGAKAIQNINATSLDGGGTGGGYNNIPGGGASFGSINLGGAAAPTAPFPTGILPGVGGGRLGVAGVGETQMPIRAYVLAGDVENGVQANLALNNRRRLAG